MSRKPTRAGQTPARPRSLELDITGLGLQGDGLASHEGVPVFVPYTVAGDHVLARVDGRRGDGWLATSLQVLSGGPSRVEPPCPYFGRCGGCALQHLEQGAYAAWKRNLLSSQLSRAGIDTGTVGELRQVAAGSRRRAAFALQQRRGVLSVGFNARASHEVVDLADCLLLSPPVLALLPALREVLAAVCADGCDGDAVVTLTDTGLDLLVEAEARLDLFDRQRLAAFADAADLARLSWRRPGTNMVEPVARRRAAVVSFSGVPVEIPPGAFLQPSVDGERLLTALVTDALGGRQPVADLFAGVGTFTYAIAQTAPVHAVEGDQAAVEALRRASSGRKITAERRDLASDPLQAGDLARYRAVVADPPRVGCKAQAEILAVSGPSLVVMVSCNPATLARDLAILIAGGYRLITVTPVDQFPWTAHLEAVAVLER